MGAEVRGRSRMERAGSNDDGGTESRRDCNIMISLFKELKDDTCEQAS